MLELWGAMQFLQRYPKVLRVKQIWLPKWTVFISLILHKEERKQPHGVSTVFLYEALFFRWGLIFAYFAENENSAKIKPAKIKIGKSQIGRHYLHACILYHTHKIGLIFYLCLLKSMKCYTLLEYLYIMKSTAYF